MKDNIRIVGNLVDVLALRSNLIYGDENQLHELFDNDEEYLYLLYDVCKMLAYDDGDFVLLDDEILRKVYLLINLKRFEIKDKHPDEYMLINELIICLNQLRSIKKDDIYDIRKRCYQEQSRKRQLVYANYYSFVESLGVDSIVLECLAGKEVPKEIPRAFILGSISYLKEIMPNLFEVDNIIDRFAEIVDSIKDKDRETCFNKSSEKFKKLILKR